VDEAMELADSDATSQLPTLFDDYDEAETEE
jgi:hypothetical protein